MESRQGGNRRAGFDGRPHARHLGRRCNKERAVDHISLSDPVTWVGILIASFLIAGLRWVMRKRPSPHGEGGDPGPGPGETGGE